MTGDQRWEDDLGSPCPELLKTRTDPRGTLRQPVAELVLF